MKARYPAKRIRPMKAPAISAGVMTANFIWKAMNKSGGMVGANAVGVVPTPRSMKFWKPPMIPEWSGPKASEYPTTIHITETTPMATNDWAIVERTLRSSTSPP